MLTSAPSASSDFKCRSIGRAPIAQPPGIDTRAEPKRASRGASTRMLARMRRTMSYGASALRAALASSTSIRPGPRVAVTPNSRIRASMVSTSSHVGDVRQLQPLGAQQRGGNLRQDRVLRAADLHRAFNASAATNDQPVHAVSLSGAKRPNGRAVIDALPQAQPLILRATWSWRTPAMPCVFGVR